MIQQSTNKYLRQLSTIYVQFRRRCFKDEVCFDSCLLYIDTLTQFIQDIWDNMPDSENHTRVHVADSNVNGIDRESIDPYYLYPISDAIFEIKRACKYAGIDRKWLNGTFANGGQVFIGGDIIKEWEAFRASLSSYNSSHSSSSTSAGRSNRSRNTRS